MPRTGQVNVNTVPAVWLGTVIVHEVAVPEDAAVVQVPIVVPKVKVELVVDVVTTFNSHVMAEEANDHIVIEGVQSDGKRTEANIAVAVTPCCILETGEYHGPVPEVIVAPAVTV